MNYVFYYDRKEGIQLLDKVIQTLKENAKLNNDAFFILPSNEFKIELLDNELFSLRKWIKCIVLKLKLRFN